MFFLKSALFIFLVSHACWSSGSSSPEERGKRVYYSNCISCHNKDPNLKGPIGPEIVKVPLDVFEQKVMSGKYPEKLPEGFVPKRKTKLMRPLTKLKKDDITDMHSWIESMNKSILAK